MKINSSKSVKKLLTVVSSLLLIVFMILPYGCLKKHDTDRELKIIEMETLRDSQPENFRDWDKKAYERFIELYNEVYTK